jgi:hypothetical protein
MDGKMRTSKEQVIALAPNTAAQPDVAVYPLGIIYLYFCHTVPLPLHTRSALSPSGSSAASDETFQKRPKEQPFDKVLPDECSHKV